MSAQPCHGHHAGKRLVSSRNLFRQRTTTAQPTSSARRGFTMVELLVVIVIILSLMGLLLPAINSVRNTARINQVRVEITALEKAIADFKFKYGVEPPSRIYLYETTSNWGSNNADAINSKIFLRQMWPQFGFVTPTTRDINGDGDTSDTIELTGSECLVFFLGGIPEQISTGSNSDIVYSMTGFSKNPANPFSKRLSSEQRVGPFFEFKQSQFVNLDTNNMQAYRDPLPLSGQTNPYLYGSSYGGRGYDNGELTGSSMGITTVTATTGYGFYRQGGLQALSTSTTVPENRPFYRTKSFQIISPGLDGVYGRGGGYNPGSTSALSANDLDNITNFSTGTLE